MNDIETSSHNGSCHCGAVKYEISSEVKNIVNCHCKVCRSHSGTSLSTYAVFPFVAFNIVAGEELLSSYKLDQATKHFCSQCGTGVFNLNPKYAGACMVFYGTLDDFESNKPQINIWCESKLNWIEEVSSLHSFEQGI